MPVRWLGALCRGTVQCLMFALVLCQAAHALDHVIVDRPQSALDSRNDYAMRLLQEVLQRTEREYGPYQIDLAPEYMERERMLRELVRGTVVNVIASLAQPRWEQSLISVQIPIDLGLQSWRVALINQKDQQRFRSVQTVDEVKRLSVGVGHGWASHVLLTAEKFNVVTGVNFEGLYEMLNRGRFDYFLRGVNEVFPELDGHQLKYPSLALDDSFVVRLPLPWLFFISPASPRLGERISAGMEAMLKDGSLKRFMLGYHKDFLVRAKLCTRRVFEVPNANVSSVLLARKDVWFNPLDPVNGFCPGKQPPAKGSKSVGSPARK